MKTGNDTRAWLSEFEKHTGFSETFYARMHEQLSPRLYALQPGDISRFQLIPDFGMDFGILEQNGTKQLNAQLLNIDMVYPVVLAWDEDKDGLPQFRWLHFPDDDIAEELANRKNLDLDKTYAFALEVQNPVWPHVVLELTFGSSADMDALEKDLHILLDDWNRNHAEEGAVHRLGKPEKKDGERYVMDIDFGSTGKTFLEALLTLLEKHGVQKVSLDSP